MNMYYTRLRRNFMKKLVVLLMLFLCFLFCSCTADTSGYKSELTSRAWSAKLQGGAEAKLSFSGDKATFSLKSNNTTACIEGKYIADEHSFVIFMPDISQNYTFEYTPKGENLELKYNGSTITLNEIKQS